MNNSALLDALFQIKTTNPNIVDKEEEVVVNTASSNMVDIITFCNDPNYLALPQNKLKLWLPQVVVLKAFYMGTIGNEHLTFNDKEIKWLEDNCGNEVRDGIEYKKNIDRVLEKIKQKQADPDAPYFSTLQLVWGRRASKTLMASIITTYEAYKLLVINDGDPHGFYNLPDDDEIAIINVALSQKQSGRLFGQVQARIRNSPFFKGKIAKETTSEIRLYTKSDMEKRENAKDDVNISVNGSILLLCGHSNPDSLAGYSTILLLFDEIAFYDDSGKITGTAFFNRLKPSLAKFYKYKAARIVMISSPNGESGIFYNIFSESNLKEKFDKDDKYTIGDRILSFQLPTWCVNEDVLYNDEEMRAERKRNPEAFVVEYGAQWANRGTYGNYFPPDLITRCIKGDIGPHLKPQPGYNYYLHVDPANGGNNYSAVLVAKKKYVNYMGKRRNMISLARVWVWRPAPGIGIMFHQIDQEILKICATYRPIVVTYDDYQSAHSLQLLRSNGINTRRIPYNRSIKMKIYQNLKDLMSYMPLPELQLYDDGGDSHVLAEELRNLKFKSINRGITFLVDKEADIKTDDIADCLAGACTSANDGLVASLPAPVTVYAGFR